MRSGCGHYGRTTRGEPPGKRSAERGAALVELAIALPLVVMLIVGMVSAGVAYNHQLSLTHAAREGGRYAATLPVRGFASTPPPTQMELWLDDVAGQIIEDSDGSLAAATPGFFLCVAYVHPNGTKDFDRTTKRTEGPSGTVAYAFEPCIADDGRPPDEIRVQVIAARDVDFNALFFSTTVTLDSEAVNRFEAGVGLQ